MKLQRLTVLALGLLLCSCASDGGSSGTGISTTTAGNVASVATALATMRRAPAGIAQQSLAGIRVAVEGTDVADETDSAGAFQLRGDYDSMVTLSFTRALDDLEARLDINVPAGGTLTLHDVALDVTSGTATPRLQSVAFAGTIVAVDCAAGEIDLVSEQRPDDGDQYRVLLAGSSVIDAMGAAVPCTALRGGEDATVTGTVNEDGSFGDATIVVS